MVFRVALVSLHTSPLESPGTGDAGGMNVYLLGLAESLAARGYEVELLTRATTREAPALLHTPGGVAVRMLAAGPRASVAKSELPAVAAEFAHALLELEPFDLVHSHYWLSGLAGLTAAREWGVPHVLSLHTVAALKNARLAPGDAPEPAERLEGERMLVAGSALVVAATAAERAAIVDGYRAEPAQVAVVPPGVDTSLFRPPLALRGEARDEARDGAELLGSPQDLAALANALAASRPVVLVLARIQPLKAPDLAIAAVAAVPEARRPLLVVAGGTSPGHDAYARGLRELSARLGAEDDVLFLPAQSRAATALLLRECALLLVPSHSETFGLVALEAAASGTPVIAERTSGLTDSVADGVSGVLLDSRRADDWAQAVDELLGSPVRLARLSETAAAHGAERSWERTAAELAERYVLLGAPARRGEVSGPASGSPAVSGGPTDPSAPSAPGLSLEPGASAQPRLPMRSDRSAESDALRAFGDTPVFLHAHPDDESISTGGTIAALVAAGAHPLVLTGTRGERGEVVPGPLAALEGTAGLGPHRVGELAAAVAALGKPAHAFLGSGPARAAGEEEREYADSGMRWGADGFAEAAGDASPSALSVAPMPEVLADVLAAIRAHVGRLGKPGPSAVVSYDALGGYGHPDHVRMHEAGRAAARVLGVPFFAIVEPRVEPGAEAGTAPAQAVLAVEPGSALPAKFAAMAAHATQLTVDGGDFVLSGGQRHPIGTIERFRRLDGGRPAGHG